MICLGFSLYKVVYILYKIKYLKVGILIKLNVYVVIMGIGKMYKYEYVLKVKLVLIYCRVNIYYW